MHRLRPALPPLLLSAALLAACAAPSGTAPSTPRAAGAPVAPAAAAAAAAASAPAPGPTRPALAALPTPGMPPPFATVVKDARRIEGPLVLWQKDEKVWIELPPHQFGQPFLLSPKIKSGIGEAGVLGGLMALPVSGAGGAQVVEFVRVHNQVRLQSRNLDVLAREGTPEARAVATSYTHSLLGSAAVASAPHPQHQAVLIEANGIFQSDLMGVGMMLQRAFRQGYGLDGRHSGITAVRASPAGTVIETQSHFYTGSLGTGGIAPPGAPPGLPQPAAAALPARQPQHAGGNALLAVAAAGHADGHAPRRPAAGPVQHHGARLQQRHRHARRASATSTAGGSRRRTRRGDCRRRSSPSRSGSTATCRWPTATRCAARSSNGTRPSSASASRMPSSCSQQPDDADFDTLDTGYASVRWMISAEPGFSAIGPSHVDPRSGEILDADIAIEGATTRLRRLERAQVLGHQARADGAAATGASADPFAAPLLPEGLQQGLPAHALCAHGDLAAEQLAYALDLLAARDELDPAGPEAEQFVLDYIKDTDDARDRARARPAAQLPRLAHLHRRAAVRSRLHARQRHHRLGDGIQRHQPGAARAAGGHALPADARAVRPLGHRVRLQAASPRPTRRPSCNASPRAAASRSWPSAPTRTACSRWTPRHCSSTWATTRWPSPRSGWTSPATCSGARRAAACRPTATTRCCGAR